MAKESVSNVRLVHEECASKPQAKFAKLPLESFVGKYVKLGFEGKRSDGKKTVEHMWVKTTGVHNDKDCDHGDAELVGILDNTPITEMDYAHGDVVGFKREEIEDILEG